MENRRRVRAAAAGRLALFVGAIGLLVVDCAEARTRRPSHHRARRLASEQRQPESERESHPWLIGGQFGLSFGFSKAEPVKDGSTRQGIILGINLEKRLFSRVYFQPELRFVQKGVNTQLFDLTGIPGASGVRIDGTVKLDCLQTAMLFAWKLGSLKFNPFLFVGPFLSLNLSRSIDTLNLVSLSLAERFEWFDLGIDAGVGAEFRVAARWLGLVGIRYSMGLIDLDRGADGYRSRGLEILVGAKTLL